MCVCVLFYPRWLDNHPTMLSAGCVCKAQTGTHTDDQTNDTT